VDAIGAKRYESQSGGEREIQRTMLELLNQMDGFDARGDVKARAHPYLVPAPCARMPGPCLDAIVVVQIHSPAHMQLISVRLVLTAPIPLDMWSGGDLRVSICL
jgi:hypothetical protein